MALPRVDVSRVTRPTRQKWSGAGEIPSRTSSDAAVTLFQGPPLGTG